MWEDDIHNVIHLFMSQFDIDVIEHLALSFSAEIQPQTGNESLYLNGRNAAEACVELYGIVSNQRRPGYETMELNGYEFFIDNRQLLSLDSRKSEGSQLSMHWLKESMDHIWQPLYFGSLISGTILAILGFISIRFLWRLHIIARFKERRARSKRQKTA